MNKLINLLFALLITVINVAAQSKSDSLYVASIDSMLSEMKKEQYLLDGKQFEDKLNKRTIVKRFYEGNLVAIYYSHFDSESATFYIQNDSLICVEYQLADPDIRSSLPPSTTYKFYFKNDKQFYSSFTMSMLGGAKTCDSYSPSNKDFIKEFYYYKLLGISNGK